MPAYLMQTFTLELANSARFECQMCPHCDIVGSPNARQSPQGLRVSPSTLLLIPYAWVESMSLRRLFALLGHGTTASSRVFIGYTLVPISCISPPALTTPWAGDDSATFVKNRANHWFECRYRCVIRRISRGQFMCLGIHSLVVRGVIRSPFRCGRDG
jgi:hypothetical protein